MEVLLIEDNRDDMILLKELLYDHKISSMNIEWADRLTNGLQYLAEKKFDVVLLDLSLPDSHGLDTFKKTHNKFPTVPIVVLTGLNDVQVATNAVRLGAQDYLVKGRWDGNLLVQSVEYAVERQSILSVLEERTNQLEKTQLALESESRRMDVTLRSIAEGVISINSDGLVIMTNKVAEGLIGWAHKDAFARPLSEVFHIIDEKTRDRIENPIERLLTPHELNPKSQTSILISKDGTERPISSKATPIYDQTNNIVGKVLVFRDISEERKMEIERIQSQKLESIGFLAGGLAHDFNNILTVITGNVALARIEATGQSDILEKLSSIENATIRAKNLTHRLLTFSKGGAPIKKTISVTDLIKNSLELSLSALKLTCNLSLPETNLCVEVDQGQIQQVIQNLAINADEAQPDGGRLDVKAEVVQIEGKNPMTLSPGNYIKISFKDYGRGIPTENLTRIFDAYFTTKKSGSGLGLASVYSIIRNHNGHISVESVLNEGTVFAVYLPVSDVKSEEGPKDGKSLVPGRGRILVMDDEELIRRTIKQMLTHLGYEVQLARHGSEVIKIYKKDRESDRAFDVVILDLTVRGGMNGKSAMERLLAIDPSILAIVSSGYSNDPIMSEYRKYGFRGVLAKPYELSEVSKVVNDVLKQKLVESTC